MSEISYTGEGLSSERVGVRLDLKKEDIHPEIPGEGGTVLVLQVNAKDDRTNPDSPEFGALVPEAAEQTKGQAESFFNEVFSKLSDEQKAKVAVIVFASDAPLVMPAGTNSPHRRAFETGEKVIEGIMGSMTENGVDPKQLLNNADEKKGEPVGVSGLVDLTMWEKPEFVNFLKEKWGKKMWAAYEEDADSNERIEMGAEGPAEIAIRMREALTGLTLDVAKGYHEKHPDSLLYIWAVSHYDSISPWVKGYVYQADPSKLFAPAEKGGGVTIKIDKDGETAETTIGGEKYQIPSLLRKPD